jgi:hypothetical protein
MDIIIAVGTMVITEDGILLTITMVLIAGTETQAFHLA